MTPSRIGFLATRYRLLLLLVAVAILGEVLVSDFFAVDTVQSVLNRATIVGFLALGLTPVLIAGQIDISIGSTLSMAGIATVAAQSAVGMVPSIFVGIGVGLAIGAINALVVVVFKVDSLVATLATLLIFASLALLLTNSQPVSSVDPLFGLPLTKGFLFILTPRSTLFIVAALAMFVWLRFTPSGRKIYAVGSNIQAARASGIRSNAYLVMVFLISGGCAGIAGVLQAFSTATGSPIAGTVLLIPAVTAVVIGGTRLEGGRGSSLATFGGVVALGALTMMLEFRGVPAYTQEIFTGIILIVLITADRFMSDAKPRKSSPKTLGRNTNPMNRGGSHVHTQ